MKRPPRLRPASHVVQYNECPIAFEKKTCFFFLPGSTHLSLSFSCAQAQLGKKKKKVGSLYTYCTVQGGRRVVHSRAFAQCIGRGGGGSLFTLMHASDDRRGERARETTGRVFPQREVEGPSFAPVLSSPSFAWIHSDMKGCFLRVKGHV